MPKWYDNKKETEKPLYIGAFPEGSGAVFISICDEDGKRVLRGNLLCIDESGRYNEVGSVNRNLAKRAGIKISERGTIERRYP